MQTESIHDQSKPKNKNQLYTSAAYIIVPAVFFIIIGPPQKPSLLLIVGFVMLASLLFGLWRVVLVGLGLDQRLSTGVRRAVLGVGTGLPVLLIMLQSIGQLGPRDILTLSLLCVIGFFYLYHVLRR